MTIEAQDWLRHPLVTLVIGFILTGVLGTAITQHFLDRREQEKLRAQRAIDIKEAIQQFSRLNAERTLRAELMLGALRSAPDDEQRGAAREAYENAYVAWSVERPGTLLMFRDLLASENYELVKTKFEQNLVGKVFHPTHLCLTTALERGNDKAAVDDTLKACRIDELLEVASSCSLALAATVSDLAESDSEWFSGEQRAVLQQRARDSIGEQCP